MRGMENEYNSHSQLNKKIAISKSQLHIERKKKMNIITQLSHLEKKKRKAKDKRFSIR
jgi:hypothetical protein